MAILSNPRDLPYGRLIGLDLGQARHGVAVSDELGIVATPLLALARCQKRSDDFAAIAAIVSREHAVGVLVGLPHSYGEERSAQARWTQRYAGRLAGALSVPVAFWDETLSTYDAQRLPSMRRGRTDVDAAAAAFLLQSFLNARQGMDPQTTRDAAGETPAPFAEAQ
jgi:putative Holliday junction resolvase